MYGIKPSCQFLFEFGFTFNQSLNSLQVMLEEIKCTPRTEKFMHQPDWNMFKTLDPLAG